MARVVAVVGVQTERRARVDPEGHCFEVPNLRLLDEPDKAELWWRPADFADFLRSRIAIARGYAAIARRRGVEVGSDFPPDPVLMHESRLGLRLGRLRKSAEKRKNYISCVLQEQEAQLEEAGILGPVAGGEPCKPSGGPTLVSSAGIAYLLDHDRLARVAHETSANDRHSAVERGWKYHRDIVEEERRNAKSGGHMRRPRQRSFENDLEACPPVTPPTSTREIREDSRSPNRRRARSHSTSGANRGPICVHWKRRSSDDADEREAAEDRERRERAKQREGFGFAPDMLLKCGLTPNGRVVARFSEEAGQLPEDVPLFESEGSQFSDDGPQFESEALSDATGDMSDADLCLSDIEMQRDLKRLRESG